MVDIATTPGTGAHDGNALQPQAQNPNSDAQAQEVVQLTRADLDALLAKQERRVRAAIGRERANSQVQSHQQRAELASQTLMNARSEIPDAILPAVDELVQSSRYAQQAQAVISAQQQYLQKLGLTDDDISGRLAIDPGAPAAAWMATAAEIAVEKARSSSGKPAGREPVDTGRPAQTAPQFTRADIARMAGTPDYAKNRDAIINSLRRG